MALRRALLTGAALVTAVAVLSGCATAGSPAGPTSESKPSGTITFWSSLSGMADVAAAFNASQKDITVKYEEIPNGANGGYTKLSAAIDAGTGPDVAGIEYYRLPGFVGADQVVPIDDLVSSKTLATFSDQVRGQVRFGDATYAMPYDAPPLIMWYRKDVLDAAGVSVPKTWDEFEAAARAVHAANPQAYLASFFTNEPPLAPLAWQGGGKWFSVDGSNWRVAIDDKASTKVADFWQKLIDEGLIKVQVGYSDEWTSDLNNGVVNGWIGGSWSASGLKARTEAAGQAGKWIAAEPPSWSGKPAGALSGGTSFAITKDSKNKAAAAKFLQWLTTDPAAVKARGAVGTAYLAYPGLNKEAEQVAPSAYFGNDIYAVFDKASSHLVGGWAWGPNYDITNTALKDSVTSAPTLGDALEKTQSATVGGLEQSGLKILH